MEGSHAVGSQDARVRSPCYSFGLVTDEIAEIELSWLDSKEDQARFRPKLKCIYGQERSSPPNSGMSPVTHDSSHSLTPSSEPPFDRHDWIVTRPSPGANTPKPTPEQTTTTRYVIDYYSGPDDEEGNPVFVLDVRPALDDFASLAQRVKMGWEDWKTGEHENQ